MKLDIETKHLLERLASTVNETLGSTIVSIKNCTAHDNPLTFYSEFKLYTLFDSSYTPMAQYFLLDNGVVTLLLEGNLQGWNYVNQVEIPNLSLTNIVEYIKIVLSTVSSQSKKLQIVTSIDDVEFYEMPSIDKFQQIESSIKPPVVLFKNNSFSIFTCLIEGRKFFDCLINVQLTGEIEITDKNLILEDIPVDELVWD